MVVQRYARCVAPIVCAWGMLVALTALHAQPPASSGPVRGSIVEDRAARKLIEAGDARLEVDEIRKAVEIWQSVIERYPRSRHRFEAHMRLGDYFLERDRAYDRARAHFESTASLDNRSQEQRAEATLKMGICFYEARNFGKCFQIMRDVIEQFPVSPQVNQAYYYIGLGHFQLGHYSRAISALEKVGTTLSEEDSSGKKAEAGKRMFVKIEDADLAAIEVGQAVKVRCKATSGDEEVVECFSLGRNVRIVLGSIQTRLGKPQHGNGKLEVKGDDKIVVTYIDQHTADKKFDQPVIQEIVVVGDANLSITDGAFAETLQGAVLGKPLNVQINDPDRDQSDSSDQIKAVVEVYRPKTDEELEAEQIKRLNQATDAAADEASTEQEIEKLKRVDRVEVTLTEAIITPALSTSEEAEPATPTSATSATDDTSQSMATEAVDESVHTGVFRVTLLTVKNETADESDDTLQALPGDTIRVAYLDEQHTGSGVRNVQYDARGIEGNLGGVRVTRAVISDQELRIRTQLKTADALTNIGNRYKEFGLQSNADAKYDQALAVCEDIMRDASRLGGRLLEETYVQLWKIYFEMGRLELAAAMAQRLQREFPTSGFVDDALLQLAEVARQGGNLQRAIGIFTRLVNMKDSQLRGEAQFGVAQCYEQMANAMAEAGNEGGAAQLYDRAFQEYKRVFDGFPDSGRVGEAVSNMANYYYRQKDYARAIDTFETVLSNYPDARFLDVILFNYGRCLYRMNRRQEARQRFDQLIQDYPESQLATDAKKIADALAQQTRQTPSPATPGRPPSYRAEILP